MRKGQSKWHWAFSLPPGFGPASCAGLKAGGRLKPAKAWHTNSASVLYDVLVAVQRWWIAACAAVYLLWGGLVIAQKPGFHYDEALGAPSPHRGFAVTSWTEL